MATGVFATLSGNQGTLKRRNKQLGPLLAVIFSLLLIEIALAGSILQQEYAFLKYPAARKPVKAFANTDFELMGHTLISAVVGIGAGCAAGLQLMLTWTPESLITDSAVTLLDIAFSYNAFGYACQDLHNYGSKKGPMRQDTRIIVLQAFVVITSILKLQKLLLVHTPLFGKIYS